MAANNEALPCPDPSAHVLPKRVNHASTAALHATNSYKETSKNRPQKVNAAANLVYAKPEELPSYPVVGIDKKSASDAADQASANPKSIDWWKPEPSDSATRAATIAKDYKSNTPWKPEATQAGSQAALIAHKEGKAPKLWAPENTKEGNSAAGVAMRNKDVSRRINLLPENGGNKALIAAKGAISGHRRSESSPSKIGELVASKPGHNALMAANMAHGPAAASETRDEAMLSSKAMEAARITHIGTNRPREMYTDHPPLASKIEENKHKDALRASAISMAKQMYSISQKHPENAAGRTSSETRGTLHQPHDNVSSLSSTDQNLKQQAMQYVNLQEAAQRLATERLSKLQRDDLSAYRNYYGYSEQQSKLSIRRSGRRRASSEGENTRVSEDEAQSRRIRSQMSHFQHKLAEIDETKRRRDREALMSAAEKMVHAKMSQMDEKVFNETGKASPAMIEAWAVKARERAKAESEARMLNHGKVHVGGGKFLEQSDIDAVAAARIQPTLDEINDKAEKQRARDEEERLDVEVKKRQALLEKQRDLDLQSEQKRVKEQEKKVARDRKQDEKEALKQKRDAEKAMKAEEKKLQKEQKRKSKESPSTEGPKDGTVEDSMHTDVTESSEIQKSDVVKEPNSPGRIKSIFGKLKRRSLATSTEENVSSTADLSDTGAPKDEEIQKWENNSARSEALALSAHPPSQSVLENSTKAQISESSTSTHDEINQTVDVDATDPTENAKAQAQPLDVPTTEARSAIDATKSSSARETKFHEEM